MKFSSLGLFEGKVRLLKLEPHLCGSRMDNFARRLQPCQHSRGGYLKGNCLVCTQYFLFHSTVTPKFQIGLT